MHTLHTAFRALCVSSYVLCIRSYPWPYGLWISVPFREWNPSDLFSAFPIKTELGPLDNGSERNKP